MVVDLGCGPANQLVQVAKLNPQTHFRGVELSELMLLDAREHVKREGVTNVSFTHGNIKKLDFLSTHSVDAVFSTLTLHHLHDAAELEECFAEIHFNGLL